MLMEQQSANDIHSYLQAYNKLYAFSFTGI